MLFTLSIFFNTHYDDNMTQLVQLETVKDALDIESGDTSFDELLTDISEGVTLFIEGLLGTNIPEQTYEEVTSGDGHRLVTKNFPVTEMSRIELINTSDNSWEEMEMPFRFSSRGVCSYVAPKGFENVRVTYTAGYKIQWSSPGNHTLPKDITDLARRLVMRMYRKLGNEGEKSTSYENSTTTWDDLITKADEKLLDKHRRFLIF